MGRRKPVGSFFIEGFSFPPDKNPEVRMMLDALLRRYCVDGIWRPNTTQLFFDDMVNLFSSCSTNPIYILSSAVDWYSGPP